MTDKNDIKTKQKTGSKILVKTDSIWEFVYMYLDLLKHIGAKYDKGFYRRYEQLTNYVAEKFDLPRCKILDEYHVYEVVPDAEQ